MRHPLSLSTHPQTRALPTLLALLPDPRASVGLQLAGDGTADGAAARAGLSAAVELVVVLLRCGRLAAVLHHIGSMLEMHVQKSLLNVAV